MTIHKLHKLLTQNIGNSAAISSILLSDEFLGLKDDEKIDLLTKADEFGKSFLDKVIQSSVAEVKALFDSEIFSSYEPQLQIFKYRNTDNKTPLDLACEISPKILSIILNSRAFDMLDVSQKTEVIRDRDKHHVYNHNTLIQNSINKGVGCLGEIVNNKVLSILPLENIFEILNDKDTDNRNVIHKAVRKSDNYFKVIIESKLIQELSDAQILELLDNCDSNNNYLFKNILIASHKHSNEQSIKSLFESTAFKKLSQSQQQKILFSGELDSSKSLWKNVIDNESTIKHIVNYAPSNVQKYFIEFIKEYYWETCCYGYLKSVPARELISFANLIKIADASEQYKNVVDSENYSFLYYLSTYGLKIATIKNLLSKGFELTTRDGYGVVVNEDYILYTKKDPVGDVLSITGEYTKNDIVSGLDRALHQKGFNILAVNANYNLNLKNADIQSIVAKYEAITNIKLIILNAHGNPSDLKDSDLSLWIYEKHNKILSNDLFTSLIAEIGKNKPLDVLITSCNGQLATKVIKDILPNGSKIVTFGEKTETNQDGHHTQVYDVQQIAKTISSASQSDLNIRPITLERMLIDYLMHLSNSSTVKGIPTYTKGAHSKRIIDINSSDKCVLHLEAKQKQNLASQLCDSHDIKCNDLFIKTLEQWNNNHNLGNKDSLLNLQQTTVNDQLGVLQAINFAYSIYCQEIPTTVPIMEFCCNDLPTTLPNESSNCILVNLVEYFSSLWYGNASSHNDEL